MPVFSFHTYVPFSCVFLFLTGQFISHTLVAATHSLHTVISRSPSMSRGEKNVVRRFVLFGTLQLPAAPGLGWTNPNVPYNIVTPQIPALYRPSKTPTQILLSHVGFTASPLCFIFLLSAHRDTRLVLVWAPTSGDADYASEVSALRRATLP